MWLQISPNRTVLYKKNRTFWFLFILKGIKTKKIIEKPNLVQVAYEYLQLIKRISVTISHLFKVNKTCFDNKKIRFLMVKEYCLS
jgi:hypothetical protein